MGNSLYRFAPRKIYNATSGNTANFQFAANQITGWRHSQEDRYICLPNFYDNYSLFAVYDGHGGEDVVQYLERFLHQFIAKELECTKDAELALYLSFLNCDTSLRNICDAELTVIENDLEKDFEVPDKEERRRVLFGSTDAAGTSGENKMNDELRAAIASACIKELPSISYLTQAPVQESDESDDDYQPGDKDINFLKDEMDSSVQSSDSTESSAESVEDESMDILIKEENVASTVNKETESAVKVKRRKTLKERYAETGSVIQVGVNCGSTATVLLINPTKLFIAHVGDSKCVACIKGQAVDLTTDHRPNDPEEYSRIINAGGSVSEDGRIEGDIDMSRAFGDFRYKTLDNPFQILSVEPSVSTFDLSPDLEFIIVASDGIWNTMNSKEIIEYIKRRINDQNMELQDICGELFEELLPEQVTEDGTGCDNITAILIKFTSTQVLSSKNDVCYREIYEYRYPSVNIKMLSTTRDKSNCSKDQNVNDFKESSQSKLDENIDKEMYIQSQNKVIHIPEGTECKEIFELGSGGKASHKMGNQQFDNSSHWSHGERTRQQYKSNQNFSAPATIGESHTKQQQRIPSYYPQNQNFHAPASVRAANANQHQNSPSESYASSSSQKNSSSESCTSSSPQMNSTDYCRAQSRNNNQSIQFQLQHASSLSQILASLDYVANAIQGLTSITSGIRAQVNQEIMLQSLRSYSTSTVTQSPMQHSYSTSTVTQSPMPRSYSSIDTKSPMQHFYSTGTVTQSPMQMKDPANKDIPTTKQSVVQNTMFPTIRQSFRTVETVEITRVKVTTDKGTQTRERSKVCGCRVMPSHTKQMAMDKEKNPEQSVGKNAGASVGKDAGPVRKDAGPSVRKDAGPSVRKDAGPSVRKDAGPSVKKDAGASVRKDAGAVAISATESPTKRDSSPSPVQFLCVKDHKTVEVIDIGNDDPTVSPTIVLVQEPIGSTHARHGVRQLPTVQIDPLDSTTEKKKDPENSGQGEVVESTVLESPSVQLARED